MEKKCVSKVTLSGSKTRGWIIEISDNKGFKDDVAITHEEATKLLDLLNKKLL